MDYTKGRNLFSYKGITAGKWWNNNGVLATASNKYYIFASAQIPIISNTPLTLQFWQPTVTATGSSRAWYGKLQYFDESKTYIGNYRSTYFTTDHLTFTESPPDNAKYVAFSYQFEQPVGDVNSTTVTVNTPTHRFKLEYGSEPTEWSPAPEDYDDYTGTIIPNILARNTITLAQAVDISAYYRFYKLQSSTAAPPAKPTTITTLPPDGWSDTEPSYTEGSTNSLYFVDLTVFSDDTFNYSNVSLSSSYEAAKQAYNKSVLALDAVSPIDTKTYTGLIGTANTAADASFYFAKIHPTNYTVNWKVRFRMTVQAPEAYNQFVDIQFGGYGSTFSSYDSYVTRTGSIGMYFVNLYRATSAGINTNHKGHAVGFGLRSSTNPTSTSYKRTIYVELLETDNCEVEMSDTAVKYASIDGTGSTNYYQLTEMSVATAGQNATNNTNTSYTQFAGAVKAGSIGVKRYTLLMKDTDNTWCSFVNQANNIATSKTVTDHGFLVFDKVIYMSGAAEYASGANTSTCWDAYWVDLRYSTNCGTTLVSYKPVYLVGEIHDDGLFYFDQTTWWTQTEPTSDDGKTYIYLGEATASTAVLINTTNTFYQFYDGKFRKLSDIETLKNKEEVDGVRAYAETIGDQVDGMAEIHYGTVAPTLSNAPASSWTDTETKDLHVDDLYYDTSSGYCYRFTKSGTTYSWSRIKDSDITSAASLAGAKKRIFVAQPTVPYDVGDLWVQGETGDILKCKTARSSGSYTASEWERASKYTDDTVAETALNQSVWYAVCSTAAETTAKVATITPTTSNFRLNAGASVLVKFTATNSGAVGSITLNVNDTGAKNIKYIYNGSISNIPNAGYLKANQTYQFYYDGSYWVVQMIYNTNTNNYDRRQHNQYIKAAAAITKAHIVAGTDAGYKMLASNLAFDLSYPILYSNVAIASGAQGYDLYEALPSVNISTTGTVEGLAKNKMVYLKGTLAGNTFTVATSNWLTCVIPTTEDGFYYIPLGMVANDFTTKMYFSTSDKLYAYINGAFQRVDKGAAAIATATHQYFWHDTNGAHIGTVEGDGDSGYNSLWNSNGLMFRNNANNLAAFTTSEIQFYDGTGNADSNIIARFGGDNTKIGKTNDTHLEMDYHSLQLIDKEDNSYFYVSDLRNTQGEMTETFTGDGSTKTFFCMVRIASVSFVSINGVETSAYAFSGMGVSFTTVPANGAEIVVKYIPTETEKGRLKAYTFGIRGSGKVGAMSVAEGLNTVASGLLSHAEGNATNAQKNYSHAEGISTTASYGAHAEGGHTNAYSDFAHAEGYYTEAAQHAHAEGSHTTASAAEAHAEGASTTASAQAAHSEGYNTNASSIYSHAEGDSTTASAAEAHAEGRSTTASGMDSHAEGYLTTASGPFSHAEGHNTAANGYGSHAEGISTIANGNYSHAQGGFTIASQEYQTVIGKYNKESTVSDNFAVILGNGTGTASDERSNALTIDWAGNVISSGGGTFRGPISGTTGTFTGAVTGASYSGGAISGTTGTFTSNISAVKGTFSGAISGTTVTAGAVTSYVPTWGTDQTPVRYHCVVSAGICSFFFMGNAVAHSQGDTICTLPAGARPKTQVNVPFVKMSGNVVGVIQITTAGAVTVGFISSTTSTGRIYLNCTYPVV